MTHRAEAPLHRSPLARALAEGALLRFGQSSATCEVTVLAQAPAELAYLTSLMGAEATFRLIETNGGCRIYIPKHPRQGCALARDIGLHAARLLSAEYGGGDLKVPIARVWRVATYSINGLSVRTIARRLCVSEDTVNNIRSCLRLTNRPRGGTHGA
ncbi:hypothetical protein [Sediminicoccus sp. KRV36]|uniref:hypothetical protein n=1 Tax=Sediminicoccus sp. KRV36 TaxID=3133721 RepID=UPI00200F5343|nr:hypothetical protein [Sediminicoccus rosea]UPY36208.1 hypothetical protein LHU95_18610 [Sediminicoccus rosea]